jgi:hypothetical protein
MPSRRADARNHLAHGTWWSVVCRQQPSGVGIQREGEDQFNDYCEKRIQAIGISLRHWRELYKLRREIEHRRRDHDFDETMRPIG